MPSTEAITEEARAASQLLGRLESAPYRGYVYGYPHKTAYRALEPPTCWRDAWREEDTRALFLYLHVPFCSVRCGFCNLFTTRALEPELVAGYLDAMERQARVAAEALGSSACFARLALGGGTPTVLAPADLERLFDIVERWLGTTPRSASTSVEVSPETVSEDKLRVLGQAGVERISIGVQSFVEQEARALGRPQQPRVALRALEAIATHGFPILNIDLIYGAAGQTRGSQRHSIETALGFEPSEVYLYPLYVRPLTGLGRRARSWSDERMELYRAGRDLLLEKGFRQVSMRMFTRDPTPRSAPDYCCQSDGMVGLGPGARSYTSGLHYCTEYAVSDAAIRGILEDFIGQSSDRLAAIGHGIRLDEDERRRRHVLQSLLQASGMERGLYRACFGTDVLDDFPELRLLEERAMLCVDGCAVMLTALGLSHSDAIGPLLFSERVRRRMEGYRWR